MKKIWINFIVMMFFSVSLIAFGSDDKAPTIEDTWSINQGGVKLTFEIGPHADRGKHSFCIKETQQCGTVDDNGTIEFDDGVVNYLTYNDTGTEDPCDDEIEYQLPSPPYPHGMTAFLHRDDCDH